MVTWRPAVRRLPRFRRLGCRLVVAVAVLGAGCGGRSQETTSGGSASGAGGFAGTPSAGRSGGGADGSAGLAPAAGSGVAGALGGMAGWAGVSVAGGTGEGGAAEAGGGVAGVGGGVDVPAFDDLIVESSHMSPYEGLTVIGTFDHNSGEDSRSPPRVGVVRGGAFSLVWEQRFNRDSFGAYVVLFVDREGDGWCTEGIDPAWSDFIDNDLGADQPVVHEFDPDSLPTFVGPITCAQFDSWFGHDFPGL